VRTIRIQITVLLTAEVEVADDASTVAIREIARAEAGKVIHFSRDVCFAASDLTPRTLAVYDARDSACLHLEEYP
jgi:hypothetical protein